LCTQDICHENVVVNGIESRWQSRSNNGDLFPFRSLFPWRCYFIDFEYVIRLIPDANPEEITVAAEPFGKYARWLVAREIMGPERCESISRGCISIGEYALGRAVSFFLFEFMVDGEALSISGPPPPGINAIFASMTTIQPSERCTTRSAYEFFSNICESLTDEHLASSVSERLPSPEDEAERHRRLALDQYKYQGPALPIAFQYSGIL
jgi:hypothetical protein